MTRTKLLEELTAIQQAIKTFDRRRQELVVRSIKIEGILEYLAEESKEEPEQEGATNADRAS